MKVRMNACVLAILLTAMVIVSVSTTTIPGCSTYSCDHAGCRDVECTCGSYKGRCGCCDICYKCPGEACNSWSQDFCTDGYRCVLDHPSDLFETGGMGRCVPRSNTSLPAA